MRRGGPLERLTSLLEQGTDDDVRATTFVRGLAVGALVGAAIAGSTLWQRRQGRSEKVSIGDDRVSSDPPEPAGDAGSSWPA